MLTVKEKIDKYYYVKLRTFVYQGYLRESEKGFVSIYKELLQISKRKKA